jgi:hypothetical protein
MDPPDRRALDADLEGAPFRIGVANGFWGLAAAELQPDWPLVVFWVAAAPRPGAPGRFHLRLDCRGYPGQAPTGTFYDPDAKGPLAFDRRPKGRGRVEKVFRTDWEAGRAFYHPYDRVAASGHADWTRENPHWAWTRDRSIVDLLDVLHDLLGSSEYTGV